MRTNGSTTAGTASTPAGRGPTTPPPSPWGPILRVVLYGALLYGLADVTLLRMPAEDGWTLFGEYERLEMVQVALLLLGAGLALFAALRYPASRPLTILAVAFLVAVLVREHNNAFKDQGIAWV